MKLRSDLMMTELGDEFVVVPVGDAAQTLQGIFRMNETGKAIWDAFADGFDESSAAVRLTEIYNVELSTALESVQLFAKRLLEAGLLDAD